jgi:hypothetical protein
VALFGCAHGLLLLAVGGNVALGGIEAAQAGLLFLQSGARPCCRP